jgi:MFS family permease
MAQRVDSAIPHPVERRRSDRMPLHLPHGANAVLVLVCLAQFMVILDVSIVNVALPSARSGLGFSTTGLQWVVNAYTITFGGFLMLGGRAADLMGRRRVFLTGTALFSLASLLCALASSRGLLLGARAVQGFGGACSSRSRAPRRCWLCSRSLRVASRARR